MLVQKTVRSAAFATVQSWSGWERRHAPLRGPNPSQIIEAAQQRFILGIFKYSKQTLYSHVHIMLLTRCTCKAMKMNDLVCMQAGLERVFRSLCPLHWMRRMSVRVCMSLELTMYTSETIRHYAQLLKIISETESILKEGFIGVECAINTIRMICHYYLPPCGNATHFEPPTSVCSAACQQQIQTCQDFFGRFQGKLQEMNIDPLTCLDNESILSPLPHSCSDLGLVSEYISTHTFSNETTTQPFLCLPLRIKDQISEEDIKVLIRPNCTLVKSID